MYLGVSDLVEPGAWLLGPNLNVVGDLDVVRLDLDVVDQPEELLNLFLIVGDLGARLECFLGMYLLQEMHRSVRNAKWNKDYPPDGGLGRGRPVPGRGGPVDSA